MQTDSNAGVTNTTDTNTWALPKDAGNTTINITMIPWVYTPSGYVAGAAVTDALLMKSEPVTVSPYTITGSPMWAGNTSGGTPNPFGSEYSLWMTGGTPTGGGSANYTATVTNSTHYDLQIGFIQTLDSFQYSNTYNNGYFDSVAGSSLLDSTQTNLVWYSPNAHGRVNAGGTANITSSDTPENTMLNVNPGPPIGFMTAATMSAQFQTHVVVYGGWSGWQTNAPVVPGVPIALSTAAWHLYGNVSGLLTATPTVSLGAGSGPLPTPLPGPNAAWTSTGDGVAKYLSWNGNAAAVRNGTGNSGWIFATTSEDASAPMPGAAWNTASDEPDRSGMRGQNLGGSSVRSAQSWAKRFVFGRRSFAVPVVNIPPRGLPVVAGPRTVRPHALDLVIASLGGQ
jgi:hypothetical protein